jgi:hypothetical protein
MVKHDSRNHEVSTRTAKMWLDDAGILWQVAYPTDERNFQDAIENVVANGQLAGDIRRPSSGSTDDAVAWLHEMQRARGEPK